MTTTPPIAFVTGASRGIGKQAAIALAKCGFDLVLTARTMHEGEEHERGADQSDTRPVAGSLDTTAAAVRAQGRACLCFRLDLLDGESIRNAVDTTLATWGRIDVLVNNGVYQGPGLMKRLVDLDQAMMATIFQGNVFAPLDLVQRCLPGMLARNRGCVINLVSYAGQNDPPAPVGSGGWGFAYAAGKAALTRMVGVLQVEHRDSNLTFFNVEPGFIITELMREKAMSDDFSQDFGGAPPEVPAAVIAWLASDPEARHYQGTTVDAQRLCLQRGLYADWRAGKGTR